MLKTAAQTNISMQEYHMWWFCNVRIAYASVIQKGIPVEGSNHVFIAQRQYELIV